MAPFCVPFLLGLTARRSSLVARRSSLVARRSSLVARRSSLVAGCTVLYRYQSGLTTVDEARLVAHPSYLCLLLLKQ